MPELKIPGQGVPYFVQDGPLKPAEPTPQQDDLGTKALVARLQEKLDATLTKKPESTDIWRVERDAEMRMLRGTLTAMEQQTSGAIQTLVQQQAEQARQLREYFEQQAAQRPRRIRAPSGKVYEVE